MIFNKQYSREEYEKLKTQFQLHTATGIEKLKKECVRFFQTQPHKCVIAEHNERSSGDHLFHSQNAYHCFDSVNLEDCAYCAKLSLGIKSSMDYNSWGDQSELIYQSSACGDHCYHLKFCTNCTTNMNHCEYCAGCFSCSNCFGCVGLKKENFCILNTKYSETDYHSLKRKIIEHMKRGGEYGEFFPVVACPFGYNETLAMDACPLSREMALAKGFPWYEEDRRVAPLPAGDVENNISTCDCGRNFKIIAQELSFYQKLHIPIPKHCPSCRHKDRMKHRNPLALWERNCAKCHELIQTSYAPERREILYCEKCYLEAVY